jgi:biopolymer transport protein ExbD
MAELNVTPLLDLAFVLLIIFIITTPLMENGVALQLPKGSEHDNGQVDPKDIRTVSIAADGQVYLEQQPVELPVLKQELAAFVQQNPDAAVVIRADKSLRYQQVMDTMDTVRASGIAKMQLKNASD